MKSKFALAAFIGLFSIQSFALSAQTVVCTSKSDARIVELDMNSMTAVVKTAGSKATEVMKYTDTDSGTLYFEGPVHIFDFTLVKGFRGGVGYGNIADTKENINLVCFAK